MLWDLPGCIDNGSRFRKFVVAEDPADCPAAAGHLKVVVNTSETVGIRVPVRRAGNAGPPFGVVPADSEPGLLTGQREQKGKRQKRAGLSGVILVDSVYSRGPCSTCPPGWPGLSFASPVLPP